MNYLKMTGYIVRTASDSWTLGYEGENNARTLRVKTTDSLTNFATVNLLIDTLDCGAMTVETVSNYKVLSMVLTAGMLGEAGMKTCQLLMMNAEGTVIKKTNQFYMVVGRSNAIEGTVPDSPVITIISDYVEEKVDELLDNFTIATDTTLTQAGMAADAKATGDEITAIKADLGDLDDDVSDLNSTIAQKSEGYIVSASGDTVNVVTDKTDAKPLRGIYISGKSVQDGTPTPENAVAIVGHGTLDDGAYYTDISVKDNGVETTVRIGGISSPLYDGDIIDLLHGKVYRYNKVLICNGSENWTYGPNTSTSTNLCMTLVSSLPADYGRRPMLCNRFVNNLTTNVQNASGDQYIGQFGSHIQDEYSNYLYFRVPASILSAANAVAWKTWLASNNIVIVVRLKNPIEEDVTVSTDVSGMKGFLQVSCDTSVTVRYAKNITDTFDNLGKLQIDIDPTDIQAGKYTNSPVGASVGIYSSVIFTLGMFDVEPNTKYVVQTQGITTTTKYFAFANSANKIIAWIEQTVAADGDVFTVEIKSPEDAVKLYVNSTDNTSRQTSAQYINLKKKLIQTDTDLTDSLISADQMRLALSAQKTFTSTLTDNYADNRLPTFVHVTDVHGDAVRFANAVKVAEAVNADAILNTGDSVMYNPTDDLSFMADTMANADFPMLPLVGNHESYTQTEQQMYTNVIQPFTTGLTLDTSVDYPTYYYRDFADENIRVIGVNQFQYRGVSNMTTQRHYHQAQIDFLCNALLSTPSGYGIIIMLHTPEAAPSKSTGYDKFYQDEILYWNTGGSIKPIYEIVDAYISGTTLSKTYDNASENTPTSFTVDADFSGKNNTEFICYVSGHNHSDAVYYVTGVTNKQLMLNAVCTNCWSHRNPNGTEGSNYPYYCELSDLPRVSGTPTENAVNVYSIDRARKTVRIVRIGSDMPYSLGQKRDCMIIPYAEAN